jgi:hypothetical protein
VDFTRNNSSRGFLYPDPELGEVKGNPIDIQLFWARHPTVFGMFEPARQFSQFRIWKLYQ